MQAKDNLERFVLENRAAFDERNPGDKIWSNIETALDTVDKPRSTQLWYWKAAVILLLGAVTFLMVDKFMPKNSEPLVFDEATAAYISNMEKFNDLEVFYTSIITDKQQKLTSELSENESIFNYLEGDISVLDLVYTDLKEQFLEGNQSDEVLESLLHVLRKKIHLINSQLEIIGNAKFPAKPANESGDLSL